ncbi:MAG: hypothetical protein H6673_02440 [Anaerolineales bacterium]|nr:hypothetical protein [Anaerolineales bacterium]
MDSVTEWFAGSTINCVYGAALALGLAYSLMLVIFQGFGDALDGLGDVAHVFHIDLNLDADAGGHDGLGVSVLAIAVFIAAFGAFGLASRGIFEAGVGASIIVAAIGGFLFGGVAQAFFIFILSPTTSSLVSQSSLAGQVADVVIPIPAEGQGQIMVVAQGSRLTYSARSYNKQPITRGTEVRIEKIVGSVATVIPVDDYEL